MINDEDLNRPLEHHFTIFIYHFFHSIHEHGPKHELHGIFRRWLPWFTRLEAGGLKAALDDSYFFLPFAKRFIFPEFQSILNSPEGYDQLARTAERFRTASPGELHAALAAYPVIHLALRPEEFDRVKDLELTQDFRGEAVSYRAVLDWADLFFFPHGSGFLVLKVRLAGTPRLSDVIEFNSLFRQVLPPKVGWKMADLRAKNHPGIHSVRDLAEHLLSDATADEALPAREGAIDAARQAMSFQRREARYLESELGQIYGDRFFVYSYSCVDYPDEFLAERIPGCSFDDAVDKVLYEYGTYTGLGSSSVTAGNLCPSAEYATRLMRENRISLWRNWRALALRETATFLAFKENEFNRAALPQNIENDYLNLYVYTLYQKIELFKFSSELLLEENNPRQNMRSTRLLVDNFTEFRNRFWFVEITKRPQGDFIYEKYQEGMQSLPLFEAVNREIGELNSYYEMKLSRKTNSVLAVLTFFLTPLALTMAFWGMNVFDYEHFPWSLFELSAAAVLLISVITWYVVMRR